MSDLAERIARLSPDKRALLEQRLKGEPGAKHPRIPRRETSDPCPLSFAQQRLWFLDQMQSGSPVYNIPMGLRFDGPLNREALEGSLNEVVRRHESLRTTFRAVEGQPVQIIVPAETLPLPVLDLGEIAQEEREARAMRLATEEARRPFDLARGPLMRAVLLRLGHQDHILLLTMHHIVSDGWSRGVLFHELSSLYPAACEGTPSPLAELPIQYADFALWQRDWLQGEVLEAQLSYWKQKLAGSPSLLSLPTDRPRPAIQTYRGARQSVMLPQVLARALRNLGRQEGTTLFMTLLAAFKALLHRYTGEQDVVVGTPIANRNRVEIESLIGFFANTLVLRSQLPAHLRFRDLLSQVRTVCLEAYAHQDLPFEKLVRELQPERSLSHAPLFQVMFALQNAPGQALELPGLTVRRLEVDSRTAKFDLALSVTEEPGGLRAAFEYNTDLFNATTIERMLGHYQTLLEGVVTDPDLLLSALPLLTEGERRQLLVQWNATRAEDPGELCLHQLFEDQAQRTPDAVAVVFEDGQLDYRELNRRANQLAHYLRKLGIGPEVLVAVCAERSLEMVIAVLAVLKAGGAYVPLDPAYPARRLGLMLEDAQAPVVLTQEQVRARLPSHGAHVVCLDTDWRAISAESAQNPVNGTRPTHAAYVIFTSGSTGRPKGVVVEHRSVLNLLAGLQRAIYAEAQPKGHQTRFTLNGPLTFDASIKHLFQLLKGHALYIVPEEIRADGEALLAYLQRHELDVLDCTPAQLELLLPAGLLQRPDQAPALILVGGEAMAESTWRTVAQAKGTAFYNLYGPTECTVAATVARIEVARTQPTIGRPIANTQIYLVDPQLNPVPVGVHGELCIGGLGLARGYLRRPALTAERFIPNPFSHEPGARLYRTGDRARYLPDGTIEFLGRLDHQVKIRGFRVELGEIETILSHHPDVRDAVALVREEVPDQRRLVAYVVLDRVETTPTTSELRRFLKQRLPDHMVPSAFVFLEALPRTSSGKVDRSALPAPDTARPDLEETFVVPRSAVECHLASAWQDLLGVDRVGVYDNFFDLGGHSLLSMQVIARLEKELGVRIAPRDMIRQTLGQIAALYDEQLAMRKPPETEGMWKRLSKAIRRLR